MHEQFKYDNFIISYTDDREVSPFDTLGTLLGIIKPDNLGRPETAIVVPNEDRSMGHDYYILYGDWRNEYNVVAHRGLDACMSLFHKHIEHISDTSDVPEMKRQS